MFDGLAPLGLRRNAVPRLDLVPTDPINRGLVGFWPLTDGAGAVAREATPYRRQGALTNITATSTSGWTTSKFGRALSFDGSDDYVVVPHASAFNVNNTGALSISAWANPRAAGTYRGVVTKGRESGAGALWGIWISDTQQWHFRAGSNAVNATGTAALNTWTHLVLTIKDGANFFGYVNQAPLATSTVSITNTTHSLFIGYAGLSTDFWSGALSNIRVFDRVISLSEIARLYREPWAGTIDPAERLFFAVRAPAAAAGVTGTSSFALADFIGQAAGAAAIGAASAATLRSVSDAATGAASLAGAATATLRPFGASAAATAAIAGTSVVVLGAATGAAAASAAIIASATATLGAVANVAAGQAVIAAGAVAALATLQGTAAGALALSATASVTLQPIVIVATDSAPSQAAPLTVALAHRGYAVTLAERAYAVTLPPRAYTVSLRPERR